MIDRVPVLVSRAGYMKVGDPGRLLSHKQYVNRYGEEMPEIRERRWSQAAFPS